jgi:hypothetical protein
MYKNPEIIKLAKSLKSELALLGLVVSITQAIELTEKTQVSRNPLTEQAHPAADAPQTIDRNKFATNEAGQWMFAYLGRFANDVDGLIKAIANCFLHSESREVEQAVHHIFGEGDCPVLNPDIWALHRVDELPLLFAKKVSEIKGLAERLLGPGKIEPEPQGAEILFKGQILDWERVAEEENLAEKQLRAFEVEVKQGNSQISMDVYLPYKEMDELDGTDQMSLVIEINQGLPCVHITNSMWGDQVLSVFATKDGLYLRPDSSDLRLSSGVPRGEALKLLVFSEQFDGKMPSLTVNHAFIEAPNT